MHARLFRPALVALALAAALSACASGGFERVTDASRPHAVGEGTPVAVKWGDPAQFAELRYSRNRQQASQGDWVEQLAQYIATRTARVLPTGERVEVEILDIKRAGDYEWLRSQNTDIRVMRDIYPPRMDLRFRRLGADGRTIAEGERHLSDLAYLMGPQPLSTSDPLRYEKRMIDRWVQKEFVSRR